jgi:2,5-furandicarboxylate decarboxylase 1
MITRWNSPYTPDLRGFIAYLEKEHPEEIVRIGKEVDPKFGVSGILERLERDGKFPLVIFEHVKGSKIPLVANMHASFERLRYALGMEAGDIKQFVRECAARQAHPIDPVMVEKAPVQEVISLGKDVDVEGLPICTYHEKDAGKYITAGLAVMRDPETGINNVGIYRHMVHEKNLLGVQLSETADGNIIWKKYEKRGLPCPIAIVIGHHPAFFIGALCFSTLDSDEIRIAGGMLQRPVPLVACKTIPLEVPADAEIVLECEIRPVERRAEAPFGEYPGTYGPRRMNPVLEIKAITSRRDPLYQNAFVGHADNLLLSGLIRTSFIEETIKIGRAIPLHLLCRDREDAGGRGQARRHGGIRRRPIPQIRGGGRPRRRHQ